MTITAKELALKLGLSATAVSMALNNRPGVSTKTRTLILETAEKYGYDFSKKSALKSSNKDILFITYRAYDAVLNYQGIFYEIYEGIEVECKKEHYNINMVHITNVDDDLDKVIGDLRVNPVAGIILLGTATTKEVCLRFISLKIPIILVDSQINTLNCSSVSIDNNQGAYVATEYLINFRHTQPGYICSSLRLNNFEERKIGFYKALKDNGLSPSNSVIHEVSPSIEGAFADMLKILENSDTLADCYFTDNDLIAIGAIKALTIYGIKIPEQVGIIGFDNIDMCRIIQPSLTSISIPRNFIGRTAVRQLLYQIQEVCLYPMKIQLSTKLVKRFSV